MRKTKIICTLGPATDNEDTLRCLMLNGMDVARINMSHQDHNAHKIRIKAVKKLRDELSLPVALLLDTKGPEIRIGNLKENFIKLKKGQDFTLTTKSIIGDENQVSINFEGLIDDVSEGTKILLDDGLISLLVKERTNDSILCKVLNNGILASQKSVNIPGIKLSLPFISPKDSEDIKFAVNEELDFIAASFTRNAQDIKLLRQELEKVNGTDIKIIAKIENSDGINNIDEIIRVSDGIMVARGDLGVEVPIEDIPVIQKKLIKKSRRAGKHVIIATQMLDSMIKNPRPTRAESTDVANAIYDGTTAIMLSGETAAGLYPVEALKTMVSIALRTELDIDYNKRFSSTNFDARPTITSAISHATCTTAMDLNASAILTVTKSGRTASIISQYKPSCPIISGSSNKRVLRQMNLFWGVIPLYLGKDVTNTNVLFNSIVKEACSKNYIKNGDVVVITAGIPLGQTGITNLLKVHVVGDILISGHGVNDFIVEGNLCVCKNSQEALEYFKPEEILVISEISDNIIDIIKEASGLILETSYQNFRVKIPKGFVFDKPIITDAKDATKILNSSTFVTIDAKHGIVFNSPQKI